MRTFDLVVTTCGNTKVKHPAPAAKFYAGPFAQMQMRAARALNPTVGHCILSNKHGFMRPTHIIPGPYNSHWGYPDTMPDDQLQAMVDSWNVPSGGLILCTGAYEYAWQTRKFFDPSITVLWLNMDMISRGIGYQMERLVGIIRTGRVPEQVYQNVVRLDQRKLAVGQHPRKTKEKA